MPFELTPVQQKNVHIARELFVRTADDNYITARWCFMEGVVGDFLWLSVHALEKYLKAILLMNGKSSIRPANSSGKKYGHNISQLFENVRQIASELLPTALTHPPTLDISHWREERVEHFVARLLKNGNAHNRYLLYGYGQHADDLYKLDQMVFACRRLCIVLDAYWGARRSEGSPTFANRELLQRQTSWWDSFPSLPLEKARSGERGKALQDALLRLNIPFAPDNYEHEPIQERMSFVNPVLLRVIPALDPNRKTDKLSDDDLLTCEWLLANVALPNEFEKEIRRLVKLAKQN